MISSILVIALGIASHFQHSFARGRDRAITLILATPIPAEVITVFDRPTMFRSAVLTRGSPKTKSPQHEHSKGKRGWSSRLVFSFFFILTFVKHVFVITLAQKRFCCLHTFSLHTDMQMSTSFCVV